jgi:CheY-like chemotaxis protein
MPATQDCTPIKSLVLIDDNEFDLSLYRRLASRSGAAETIHTFNDAGTALDYLRKGGNADAIVLDINMPGINGFEFLDVLSQELVDDIPPLIVVMLTTSRNDADRTRAAMFPIVKEYICKPPTTETFWQIAQLIRSD